MFGTGLAGLGLLARRKNQVWLVVRA
jgi:hypothetical protein